MVKLNGLTREWVEASHCTFSGEDQRSNVCFPVSSVYTHRQEKQKNNRGNELHTNVDKCGIISCGFVDCILPTVKANFFKHVQGWVESLTIKDCLVSHEPFPKQPFRRQSTDVSNATIDWQISFLGAGA